MPPIVIAFFILIGAMTGPPLVKGLDPRPDRISHSKLGKPAKDAYRTWTSRQWIAVSDDTTHKCAVTYFALSTRRTPVRLTAGDQEQALDTSWSFPREVAEGERHAIAFTFREPVGGKQLACQEQAVACISARGPGSLEMRSVTEGQCAADASAPASKGGKPRLTAQTPPFTMNDPATGGAFVDVTFEITGRVTEEWYCPAIDVLWPDETHSKQESDCEPFPGPPEQRFRWKFNHGFPGGEWRVHACLSKGGRQLACEDVTVRVLGGGN